MTDIEFREVVERCAQVADAQALAAWDRANRSKDAGERKELRLESTVCRRVAGSIRANLGEARASGGRGSMKHVCRGQLEDGRQVWFWMEDRGVLPDGRSLSLFSGLPGGDLKVYGGQDPRLRYEGDLDGLVSRGLIAATVQYYHESTGWVRW